jgi:hypothetical protein
VYNGRAGSSRGRPFAFRGSVSRAYAIAVALSGCTFQPPGPIAPDDEHTDVVVECETTLSPFPGSGETGVYPRTTVEASFLFEPDPSATLQVDGLVGTAAWRESTLVFTPSRPMRPNTGYTARVTRDCAPQDVTWTFTTSDVGPPVDGSALPGRAYVLDLESGRWIAPAGVGQLLTSSGASALLVGVAAADAGTVELVAATALQWADPIDACAPTMPFPAASFDENPFVAAGPAPGPIAWDTGLFDAPLPLTNVRFTGSFAPDLATIEGGTLTGELVLTGATADGDTACETLAQVGVTCGACSDATNGECVAVQVDGLTGVALASCSP